MQFKIQEDYTAHTNSDVFGEVKGRIHTLF